MGLADRKVKQRIQPDPRNLTWKNDASRFGHAYLSKLGWSTGAALGLTGDGLTDYIRVAHKLDVLGIGAKVGGREERDGRAGREFDGLLRRLNVSEGVAGGEGVKQEEGTSEETGKSKKRKRDSSDGAPLPTPSSSTAEDTDAPLLPIPTPIDSAPSPASAVPRRLAHRARFLRAKSLAKSDARAMSEILGISSAPGSGSTTPTPFPARLTNSGSGTPRSPGSPVPPAFPSFSAQSPDTQQDDEQPKSNPAQEDEPIRVSTSSLSVADYFKQKMRAKLGLEPGDATPQPPPRMKTENEDVDERPAGGAALGFAARGGLGFREDAAAPPAVPALAPAIDTSAPTKHSLRNQTNEEDLAEAVKDVRDVKKPKEGKKKRKAREAEGDVPAAASASTGTATWTIEPGELEPEQKKKKKEKKEKKPKIDSAQTGEGVVSGETDLATVGLKLQEPPAEKDVAAVDDEPRNWKEKKKKRKAEAETQAATPGGVAVGDVDVVVVEGDGERRKKKKRRTGDA